MRYRLRTHTNGVSTWFLPFLISLRQVRELGMLYPQPFERVSIAPPDIWKHKTRNTPGDRSGFPVCSDYPTDTL
jgi:hypothetical protein